MRGTNVDWCDQVRVWSHAEAITSPFYIIKWFASHLYGLQAPLVAVGEGETPIAENDIIPHRTEFFKSTASHVVGYGGEMLQIIEDFCVVFLSLVRVSSEIINFTVYGRSRCCALV